MWWIVGGGFFILGVACAWGFCKLARGIDQAARTVEELDL
jgi:hypothetical protein